MGAVALFDQADLGVICFSPTSQSFAGLEWVIQAANKQRKYQGLPVSTIFGDANATSCPSPTTGLDGTTFEWIAKHSGYPFISNRRGNLLSDTL